MTETSDIRRGRHCVFNLHVHLVFVTKYRRGVFTKEVLDDLRGIFAAVCQDFGAELAEFDGEDEPCASASELSTERFRIQPREQPQGGVQPPHSQETLSQRPQEVVGRRPMVTQLLCRKLWRGTHIHYSPIHRAAADAGLVRITQGRERRHRAASPPRYPSPP